MDATRGGKAFGGRKGSVPSLPLLNRFRCWTVLRFSLRGGKKASTRQVRGSALVTEKRVKRSSQPKKTIRTTLAAHIFDKPHEIAGLPGQIGHRAGGLVHAMGGFLGHLADGEHGPVDLIMGRGLGFG